MDRYHTGWRAHANYLTKHTPLSERQAEIVALKKTGHSTNEISEILTLYPDTIEDHWTDALDQCHRAQTLCTVMGPHPWGDSDTRQPDEIDDTPWNLLSSGAISYSDESRTRVELELYHGESNPMSNMYLLVEREIVDTASYETTTKEQRSAHESTALRGYIYDDANTLDEYYLRWALLDKAGIDPGADGTPPVEGVLDQDVTHKDADAAQERAMERVAQHSIEQ